MDNENLDFESVDTSLLRSPNNFAANNDGTSSPDILFDDTTIPDGVLVDNSHNKSNNKANSETVVQLLELAAATQGVMVSDIMTNTAIALAYKLGLDANSMEWFIAGVTYANNNMLMEKMVSAVKDLQVEVRNIQVASNSVKNSSDALASTMKSNKHDIVKELDKTRDSVLNALNSLAKKTEEVQSPAEVVTIGIAQGKKALKQLSENAIPPPQEINSELLTPTLTKVVSTKSPAETVHHEKEKLMLDLGFEVDEVAGCDPLVLDMIITDDMLQVAAGGLTEEIKEALQDQAIDNQMTIAQIVDIMK